MQCTIQLKAKISPSIDKSRHGQLENVPSNHTFRSFKKEIAAEKFDFIGKTGDIQTRVARKSVMYIFERYKDQLQSVNTNIVGKLERSQQTPVCAMLCKER